jgi:hypothetical protein
MLHVDLHILNAQKVVSICQKKKKSFQQKLTFYVAYVKRQKLVLK